MGSLSIYLSLLWICSTIFCSFKGINFAAFLWNLSLKNALILFDAIANGTIVSILFLDCSMQICRNIIDFYILVLHPETLLSSFINSNSFFSGFLRFSIYETISSAQRDNFISFFPTWIPFIYFSCIIALATTSGTVLNRSDKKKDILVSFLVLGEKHSVFHPLVRCEQLVFHIYHISD